MLKRKTETIYTSDRGEDFVVERMSSSHLINAIRHHMNQLEAVRKLNTFLPGSEVGPYAPRWESVLLDTIETLGRELLNRDPNGDDDEDRSY